MHHEQPVAVAQGGLHGPAAHDGEADAGGPRSIPHDACSALLDPRPPPRSSVAGGSSPTTSRRKGPRCFARLFAPTLEVQAHCDLPCGVYDPAQARIEAESIKAIIGKLADNDDPDFRTRAVIIKEQRSELVKHHLWVLWTDYFKPPHFEKYPQLHQLFNEATKLAGATGTKGTMDAQAPTTCWPRSTRSPKIFWETKKA